MFFYREVPAAGPIQATANFESVETNFDSYGSQDIALHSSSPLSTNQLATGGTSCRRVVAGTHTGKYYFKTDAYGGAFYNIPDTKKISARACVRTQNYKHIFLSVKDSSTFANNGMTDTYLFGIYDGRIALLSKYGWMEIFKTGIIYTPGTWVSLRMDVIPQGASGDRIVCYLESSPGSGVWSNVIGGITFDTTISTSDSKYIPWSNNGRCGIYTSDADNYFGGDIFFDNIDFQVENI
jgi:hypothetical protein